MKGITKKILTLILLIQITLSSIIASNQVYGIADLIPKNDTITNTTQGVINSANSIYSANVMVGDPAELPEDLVLPPNNDNNDDYDDGSGYDVSGDEEEGLLEKSIDGLAGILLLPVKVLPLLIGKVLTFIMSMIAGDGFGFLSVADILFNDLPITDINFFNLHSGDATVDQIRSSVSVWYYSIRNLSAIILLVIIVYVGIRMALSTIAEDKAKYKQMLIDWLVGFALLFVLHYIMVFIININNGLVDILKSSLLGENGKISDTTMSTMFWDGLKSISFTKGVGSALCYAMLVGITFLFLVTYIKRMVTIAFLIVIAPLVTVTYSIDKMGDSKSQALNTWLKEFSYNILIQPFQCVTYLALGQTAISILEGGYSIKAVVIAIIMLMFILTSEKIIKHIFHFQNKSMSDTLQSAIVGTTLMSLVGKKGGKKSGGSSGGGPNKYKDEDMTKPSSNPKNVGQGGAPGAGGSGSGGPDGSGQGGSGGSSSGGASRRTRKAGSSSPLGAVGHKAGHALKGLGKAELKLGGIAAGAMLGLGATGSADKGMLQGGMLVGNKNSNFVDKISRNSERRKLAREYNDYADEVARQNPKFTPEEVNEQVRQKALDLLNGKEPLNDEEKALREALKDLEKTYAKDGLDENEIKAQLSKDFDGIEQGIISEVSAPMRFVGKIKDKVPKVTPAKTASRKRKWSFGSNAGGNNQGGSSSRGAGRSSQKGRFGGGSPGGGAGSSPSGRAGRSGQGGSPSGGSGRNRRK